MSIYKPHLLSVAGKIGIIYRLLVPILRQGGYLEEISLGHHSLPVARGATCKMGHSNE